MLTLNFSYWAKIKLFNLVAWNCLQPQKIHTTDKILLVKKKNFLKNLIYGDLNFVYQYLIRETSSLKN